MESTTITSKGSKVSLITEAWTLTVCDFLHINHYSTNDSVPADMMLDGRPGGRLSAVRDWIKSGKYIIEIDW